MKRRYSSRVVAPMQRRSPRARAGFRRFAASSPACPARPAPTSVCSSSTNTITSGWSRASAITLRTRSSKAPRCSVPPSRAPTLSSTIRLPARTAGSLPSAARMAIASTTAVLPTPASPTSTGLFLLLRASAWSTARISRRRPMIGPISPLRARAVRSRPKRSRVGRAGGRRGGAGRGRVRGGERRGRSRRRRLEEGRAQLRGLAPALADDPRRHRVHVLGQGGDEVRHADRPVRPGEGLRRGEHRLAGERPGQRPGRRPLHRSPPELGPGPPPQPGRVEARRGDRPEETGALVAHEGGAHPEAGRLGPGAQLAEAQHADQQVGGLDPRVPARRRLAGRDHPGRLGPRGEPHRPPPRNAGTIMPDSRGARSGPGPLRPRRSRRRPAAG